MTDVFRLLPPFEWRGTKYPVMARSVGFAHESVQHKLQFRDGDLVQQTGARNKTFSYTLALRQDIAAGPYQDLFTVGLPKLFADCEDRSPGTLVDPIYGTFTCVPSSYTDESDIQRRDGTDIRVEFTHAPESTESDEPAANTLQGVTSDAGQLEQELEKVNWEQEPSPDGMTDPLSAIAGFANQVDQLGHRAVAALHDFAYKAEKVERSLDRLEDPQHFHLHAAVRRNRLAAYDLADRAANPGKTIVKVTVRTRRTVSSVAAELGISVIELLRLNPFLARAPMVPAGAEIQAPVDG